MAGYVGSTGVCLDRCAGLGVGHRKGGTVLDKDEGGAAFRAFVLESVAVKVEGGVALNVDGVRGRNTVGEIVRAAVAVLEKSRDVRAVDRRTRWVT